MPHPLPTTVAHHLPPAAGASWIKEWTTHQLELMLVVRLLWTSTLASCAPPQARWTTCTNQKPKAKPRCRTRCNRQLSAGDCPQVDLSTAEYELYGIVIQRIRTAIKTEFGLSELHFTAPTFVTREVSTGVLCTDVLCQLVYCANCRIVHCCIVPTRVFCTAVLCQLVYCALLYCANWCVEE